MKHEGTSASTVSLALDAGAAMGKTAILVNDVLDSPPPWGGLGQQAIRMLADGVASAKDLDTAMTLGYHPMGPLALTDLVGLDVRDVLLNLQASFNDDAYAPHPCLRPLWPKASPTRKRARASTIGPAARQSCDLPEDV